MTEKGELYKQELSVKYSLLRQIEVETRAKLLAHLPECHKCDWCWVREWTSDGEHVIGYGPSYRDRDCTVRLTLRCAPGVFCVSRDESEDAIRTLAMLFRCPDFKIYRGGNGSANTTSRRFACNNFNVLDTLMGRVTANNYAGCTLFKLTTETWDDARVLHSALCKATDTTRWIAATQSYWEDPERFVLFELYVRGGMVAGDELPRTTRLWLNAHLNEHPCQPEDPVIPTITFDFETVSSDPNRFPTGEEVNDRMVSASIHHIEARALYSLVYVPINDREPADLLREIMLDEFPDRVAGGEVDTHQYRVYTDEVSLIDATINLLDWPISSTATDYAADHPNGLSPQTLDTYTADYYCDGEVKFGENGHRRRRRSHNISGYNSRGYDMPYLWRRCVFFNMMRVDEFVLKSAYTLGYHQIHLDLMCIAHMTVTGLKNLKLNTVASAVLGETKEDVDAQAIRHTFRCMLHKQRLFRHDDPLLKRLNCPSLRDIIVYNDQDTLLVSRLIHAMRALHVANMYSDDARIGVSSLNVNYNKMQYPLISEWECVMLREGVFLTRFESATNRCLIQPHICGTNPTNGGSPLLDYICKEVPIIPMLGGRIKKKLRADGTPDQQRYPGGINFCFGALETDNCIEGDLRVAYPLVIERLNLSDETCIVLKASDLLPYVIVMEQQNSNRVAEYRLYVYMSHVADSTTATRNLVRNLIFDSAELEILQRIAHSGDGEDSELTTSVGGLENEPFTSDSLRMLGHQIVVCVWSGVTSVCSRLMSLANDRREEEKTRGRNLNNESAEVDNDLNELNLEEELCDVGKGDDKNDGGDGDGVVSDAKLDDDDAEAPVYQDDSEADEDDNVAVPTTSIGNSPRYNCSSNDSTNNSPRYNNDSASNSPRYDCSLDDENEAENECGLDGENNNDDKNNNEHDGDYNDNGIQRKPFTFEDAIFQLDNSYSLKRPFNFPEDWSFDQRRKALVRIKRELAYEANFYENRYRVSKARNASVYGIIGRLKPELAAVITFLVRATLFAMAKLVVGYGFELYYMDTDCIHISASAVDPVSGKLRKAMDLGSELNSRFPHSEIEFKNKGRIIYICTKVYYCVDANLKVSYGLNKNGPQAWYNSVQEVMRDSQDLLTTADVETVYKKLFRRTYDLVLERCRVRRNFEGFHYVMVEVKLNLNRPMMSRLYQYTLKNYNTPTQARPEVYYYLEKVQQTEYRPAMELVSMDKGLYDMAVGGAHIVDIEQEEHVGTASECAEKELLEELIFERRVLRRLTKVNLFKFYYPMHRTHYNLMNAACKRNSRNASHHRWNILIKSKSINFIMMNAFLEEHDKLENRILEIRKQIADLLN